MDFMTLSFLGALFMGLMAGDGFMAAGFHFTWLIALFPTLGENFTAFGGAAAAAALTGAAGDDRLDGGAPRHLRPLHRLATPRLAMLRVATPRLATPGHGWPRPAFQRHVLAQLFTHTHTHL